MRAHHACDIPLKVLDQAVVIPGGNTPEAGVSVQQDGACSKEVEKVRAEEHVVFTDDRMAVAPARLKETVQAPFVVLREPGMPWLTATQPSSARDHLQCIEFWWLP